MGCAVSQEHFERWSRLFICEAAPFFMPDEWERWGLPPETLILSRSEFADGQFPLSYQDSYATYAVTPDSKWVALLTPAQFDALLIDAQQALLLAQWEAKRGQVYRWEHIEPFVQSALDLAESRCVAKANEKALVLDSKVWWALSEDERIRWLLDFLTMDDPPACLSASLSPADWSRMDYPSIRSLAGTFAAESGANCFSTTLAAITRQPDIAGMIAGFWLRQEGFLRGLTRRGYVQVVDTPALGGDADAADLRDAVLVWYDSGGAAQHACYVIGDGLVLNKNSQAWFSPRQLLKLDDLLDYWKDDPFTISVYQRGGNT